jgi:putative membrane protein
MAIRLLITWFSNCLALLVAAAVIQPIGYSEDFGTLLLAGAILGVVNFIVRPWIILFTLPAVILSFGLALLASKIVDGFTVGGFWATVGGALIVWVVNATLKRLQRRPQREEARAGWDRW